MCYIEYRLREGVLFLISTSGCGSKPVYVCVLVCHDHLRYSETGCEGRNGGSSWSVLFFSAISLGLTSVWREWQRRSENQWWPFQCISMLVGIRKHLSALKIWWKSWFVHRLQQPQHCDVTLQCFTCKFLTVKKRRKKCAIANGTIIFYYYAKILVPKFSIKYRFLQLYFDIWKKYAYLLLC